jgi:hypothetical protein
MSQLNTGDCQTWNIVKTHGKTSAKAETSNSTYFSREKNCPYATTVGAR